MLVFPVYQWHFRLPGASLHDFVPPPVAPPLPFAPPAFPGPFGTPWCVNLELPNTMRWLNPIQHKLAFKTFGDGNLIAQQNHDSGTMIPHIPVPPNAGVALTLLFSKYKVMFGASTVSVEGKPVGTVFPVLAFCVYCAQPMTMPAPLGPHMLVPFPSTVRVGMTGLDFFAGYFHVLLDMAFDIFFNFLGIQEDRLKDIFKSVLGGKFIAICFAFLFASPTGSKVYKFLSSVLKPALRQRTPFKQLGDIGARVAEKAVRDFIKKLVTDTAHKGEPPKGSFPIIGGDVPRAINGAQALFSSPSGPAASATGPAAASPAAADPAAASPGAASAGSSGSGSSGSGSSSSALSGADPAAAGPQMSSADPAAAGPQMSGADPAAAGPQMSGADPAAAGPQMSGADPAAAGPQMSGADPAPTGPQMSGADPAAAGPQMSGANPAAAGPQMSGADPAAASPQMSSSEPAAASPAAAEPATASPAAQEPAACYDPDAYDPAAYDSMLTSGAPHAD